jgi:anti-sigma regulatory factor (Ser/Thr protein kinase)
MEMQETPARHEVGWLPRECGPPVLPAGELSVGEWPFRDALELGPLPGAVPCARLHVRQVLWEWGLARLTASAELLVTELVTNAVAALRSAGQVAPVRLWLLADRTRVLILVWDASLRPPVPVNAGHDAENGRGLLLVAALSQEWDWYFPPHTGGKVVWALTGLESPVPRR